MSKGFDTSGSMSNQDLGKSSSFSSRAELCKEVKYNIKASQDNIDFFNLKFPEFTIDSTRDRKIARNAITVAIDKLRTVRRDYTDFFYNGTREIYRYSAMETASVNYMMEASFGKDVVKVGDKIRFKNIKAPELVGAMLRKDVEYEVLGFSGRAMTSKIVFIEPGAALPARVSLMLLKGNMEIVK